MAPSPSEEAGAGSFVSALGCTVRVIETSGEQFASQVRDGHVLTLSVDERSAEVYLAPEDSARLVAMLTEPTPPARHGDDPAAENAIAKIVTQRAGTWVPLHARFGVATDALAWLAENRPQNCNGDGPAALDRLSKWIDAGQERDEGQMWHRVAKVAEEAGEVVDALIGWTGRNPRKGQCKTQDDVISELLDTALSALGAVEHLLDHPGRAFTLLEQHAIRAATRAGVWP